jgi:hypothetical protein
MTVNLNVRERRLPGPVIAGEPAGGGPDGGSLRSWLMVRRLVPPAR